MMTAEELKSVLEGELYSATLEALDAGDYLSIEASPLLVGTKKGVLMDKRLIVSPAFLSLVQSAGYEELGNLMKSLKVVRIHTF